MFSPVMTTRRTLGLRTIRPMVTSRERVALLRGLFAYWPHEEATAADRLDVTGNDFTLSQLGGVIQDTGKIGFASQTNTGSNKHLTSTAAGLLVPIEGSPAFTFAGWFRNDDTSKNNNTFASRWDINAGIKRSWRLIYETGTPRLILRYSVTDGTSDDGSIAIINPPAEDEWFFAAIRSDGTNIDLRVNTTDGVQDTAVMYTGSTAPFTLGASFSNGAVQANSIASYDETGLWDRRLSIAELLRLYNGGNGWTHPLVKVPAPLTMYYYS